MKSYAPEATLINLRTIGDPEVGLLSIDDARAYAEIVRHYLHADAGGPR